MRHFNQIASGLDFTPIVQAIARQSALWNQNSIRTTYPGTPHREADDMLLWFNDMSTPEAMLNDREVIAYPAWEALPQVRNVVFDLMRRTDAVRLGRTMITRLAPGARIYPHADEGSPAEYFERYQIALQSLPGCTFRADAETVHMPTGSVWWFNNRVEHEVINHSADDRLALIVDLRHG